MFALLLSVAAASTVRVDKAGVQEEAEGFPTFGKVFKAAALGAASLGAATSIGYLALGGTVGAVGPGGAQIGALDAGPGLDSVWTPQVQPYIHTEIEPTHATTTVWQADQVSMQAPMGDYQMDQMDYQMDPETQKMMDEMEERAYPWSSTARTFLSAVYGGRSKEAVPAIGGLVRLIQNEESRFPTALKAEVIRTLEHAAFSFVSHETCGAATAALAKVGRAEPRTLEVLIGKLDSPSREQAYQPALDGLVRLYPSASGADKASIVAAVEHLTHSWQSEGHREAALKALVDLSGR